MKKVDFFQKFGKPGVLCHEQIIELMKNDIIKNANLEDKSVDTSSFDLHLGDYGWKLKSGFKCRDNRKISDIIKSIKSREFGIKKEIIPHSGLPIKPDETYLFEINESIDLPNGFYGQGTGKSTIGRLDVLTRLLVDNVERYDCVLPGPKNLFIEITPLSFPIIVYPNIPIFQLRIAKGDFRKIILQQEILELHYNIMKDRDGNFVGGEKQTHLRLNLEPVEIKGMKKKIIAYKAKKNGEKPIDLKASEESYYPEDFWEPVYDDNKIDGKNAILIEKNHFYIMRSEERFALPEDIAVYGLAMTEEVGELRIHYAGFVHPKFGVVRDDDIGAPLIFEVRGHDIPMWFIHSDLMAELRYYPMSQSSEYYNYRYSDQELTLSKYFKEWGHAD